jgi:hypothetical protein
VDNLAAREPAGKAGPAGVRAVGPFAHATDLWVAALAVPEIRRSRLACQVLGILAHHAASSGRCWRSKRSLAGQLATDPSAIRRALRLLEAHGWLRREPRQGRATVYHLPIEASAGAKRRPSFEERPARKEGLLFGGARPPGEGAPRAASGGAGAPRTSQGQPEREPGHCYAGSPPGTTTDSDLRAAVVAAATTRDPAKVNQAAHGLALAFDGHCRWVGGFRQRLHHASPEDAVAALERAMRAGHGSAFFREPPAMAQGGPSGVSRPKPAQGEPDSLAPSVAEVWARFRRQGPPPPGVR